MIIPFNKQIDHLVKFRKKHPKEEYSQESFESEKKASKEFANSFNKKAKEQGSPWYAKVEECKSLFDDSPFILTYLCKRISSGWWIFKNYNTIKMHVHVRNSHVGFVNNDYVVSEYGVKKNEEIFRILPELTPVLEEIPQAVFILPKEEIHNLRKRIAETEKEIIKLERMIK